MPATERQRPVRFALLLVVPFLTSCYELGGGMTAVAAVPEGLGYGWAVCGSFALPFEEESVSVSVTRQLYTDGTSKDVYVLAAELPFGLLKKGYRDPAGASVFPYWGFGLHFGHGDNAGAGLLWSLEAQWRAGEHFRMFLWPAAYFWLGDEDDQLDGGASLLIRSGLSFTF